jgi:glycosyltransferase involved in cell wall biosynthesis
LDVLFHLLDSGIGGGQLVATRIAERIASEGNRVGVVVPAAGPASTRFDALGAEVIALDAGTLRRPVAAFELSRVVRRFDVLYSHTSIPGVILGAAASRIAGRAHLVHQHTYPYFSESSVVRAVQHRLLRTFAARSRFIAVAEHVARGLVEAGINPSKVGVSNNGVRIPVATSPPTGTPPTIGMLARLDPGKNVHLFLDAISRMQATPGVTAIVGGTAGPFGDYETRVREQARKRDISIVEVADGEAFIRTLDIVAIPSAYEGSPLVLYEAMACGRAIVASDIPGITEALGPDQAGILVPLGDAAALGHALDRLSSNLDERVELGRRAAVVAARDYALEPSIDRAMAALRRAVSGM